MKRGYVRKEKRGRNGLGNGPAILERFTIIPKMRNSWKEMVSLKKPHYTFFVGEIEYRVLRSSHNARWEFDKDRIEWIVAKMEPESYDWVIVTFDLKLNTALRKIVRKRLDLEVKERDRRKNETL